VTRDPPPRPPIQKQVKSPQIPESRIRPGCETLTISAGADAARRALRPRSKLAWFYSAPLAGFYSAVDTFACTQQSLRSWLRLMPFWSITTDLPDCSACVRIPSFWFCVHRTAARDVSAVLCTHSALARVSNPWEGETPMEAILARRVSPAEAFTCCMQQLHQLAYSKFAVDIVIMYVRSICAATAIALSLVMGSATAQEKFPFVEKSVWTIAYVLTKPGQFNAYFIDLSKVWLEYIKKQKEDGQVLSYKLLRVEFARDNEPDMIIMVEYKNMAALDQGTEHVEQLVREVQGSIENSTKSAIAREALRQLKGTVLLRELDFVR
jgi:hypothetical protein